MAYIKLFHNNDVQVSESPTLTNAVAVTLRADQNEVGAYEKLYALADNGYSVASGVITPTGAASAKWQLAPDAAGNPGTPEAYGAPLAIGSVNDTDKVYFHVRAKATDDETPNNDTTVTLVVSGVASAE